MQGAEVREDPTHSCSGATKAASCGRVVTIPLCCPQCSQWTVLACRPGSHAGSGCPAAPGSCWVPVHPWCVMKQGVQVQKGVTATPGCRLRRGGHRGARQQQRSSPRGPAGWSPGAHCRCPTERPRGGPQRCRPAWGPWGTPLHSWPPTPVPWSCRQHTSAHRRLPGTEEPTLLVLLVS